MSTYNIPKQNNRDRDYPTQNNRDYFKELIEIQKEITKIYKQLSKEETFPDILNSIKTDFINNNISIIEDNISDTKLTNYKDFNSKIIKMLNIFIKILENFNENKEIFQNLIKIKNFILEKIKKNEKKRNELFQQQELITFINTLLENNSTEELKKKENELATKENELVTKEGEEEKKKIDEEIKDLNEEIKDLKNITEDIKKGLTNIKKLDDKYKKIFLNICIFNYYIDIFSNKNEIVIKIDENIKKTEDNIKKNNELLKNRQKDDEILNNIDADKKTFTSLHEKNKKIYKDLCNFIKLESLQIIKELSEYEDNLKSPNEEKNKKSSNIEYNNFIDKFKNEIYYETININNTQVNDVNAKLKDISNERIDLESRKKLLGEMKELLYKQCNKLNNVLNYLRTSNKQEYSKELIAIRKIFPDYTKGNENTKEKDNISNISILELIINEETEITKLLAKNIEDKKNIENTKNNNRRNEDDEDRYRDRDRDRFGRRPPGGGGKYKLTGGEKKSNKYYEDKYKDLLKLNKFIENLIISIKTNEGIEDTEDPFENENKNNNKQLNVVGNSIASIYKNIWNDYVKETQKTKAKGFTIDTLKQENKLYERFKDGELDPTEILKITFEDKIIFIGIILLIRIFTMVLIEFLIDYNVIGTIYRGIVIYSVIYILLIILSVIIINYDSYKLRIIVNYLNLHINSSNIVLHIIMFCLLIGLILIIVNNNDIDSINIDNLLNYTYIYKYIYEIAEKSKYIYQNPEKITTTSYLIISEKEKMKLRYRLDIITMLIFIFSALLILVM